MTQQILVTVTGRDTPGITASLAQVIHNNGASLADIEQVVLQGQLTLCLLLDMATTPTAGEAILKDLLFDAKRMGLEMHFLVLGTQAAAPSDRLRYAITALGTDLDANSISQVAGLLAEFDANIENIQQLSSDDIRSIEITVAMKPHNEDNLRSRLFEITADQDVDIALQQENLLRRSKRLVVMDMDSTLIQMEVINELARMNNALDLVAEITRSAMAGEIDYAQSLQKRVTLLKGLSYQQALGLAQRLPLMQGANRFISVLRKLGYRTGVISGGFQFAADALKEQLGLDYAYANQLEVKEGVLTGKVVEPIVTPQRKADLLDAIAQKESITLSQTIAIGDGANDIFMLQRAGLGIAFHAKAKLRAAADTAISKGGLDRVLYFLGLHARDIADLLDATGTQS